MSKTYTIKIQATTTYTNGQSLMGESTTKVTAEEIQKLIAENPEILEVKKDGKPKEGTEYWYFGSANDVWWNPWSNHEDDNLRRDIGNFFLIREECMAQQAINFAIARVRAYIKDNELGREFVDGDDNYYFTNHKNKIIWQISLVLNHLPLLGYFKSEEAGEQVINNNTDDLNLIYGIK